jgi:hypothetical protein
VFRRTRATPCLWPLCSSALRLFGSSAAQLLGRLAQAGVARHETARLGPLLGARPVRLWTITPAGAACLAARDCCRHLETASTFCTVNLLCGASRSIGTRVGAFYAFGRMQSKASGSYCMSAPTACFERDTRNARWRRGTTHTSRAGSSHPSLARERGNWDAWLTAVRAPAEDGEDPR